VANSEAWAHIDAIWPKFTIEPCNVRLALTTDGVNPFNEKSNGWSSWLILLFDYNLPPWFITKTFFNMLGLIILGPESIKMHNMAPLIEELQELWKGVVAWNVAKVEGQRQLHLQAILMWTIHDYLGYGLVVGCVH
jgi:hypothetical protein